MDSARWATAIDNHDWIVFCCLYLFFSFLVPPVPVRVTIAGTLVPSGAARLGVPGLHAQKTRRVLHLPRGEIK